MNTTDIGKQAEDIVASELRVRGYKIVAQNWRTRFCEVDIIATKNRVVFFIEVKYRKTDTWGDGLDAISPKKLQQMTFAAELWVHNQKWARDYELMAVSASGNPPAIQEIIGL